MAKLPKLIATSVVRGSQKGQSHGGVYVIDFDSETVEQKVDWNTGEIDFTGRGWDRGLRGIEFTDDDMDRGQRRAVLLFPGFRNRCFLQE